MQKVACYECGKSYDYQEEAFCPHCGAFNQPPRSTRIAADGSVVRVDGLSEAGHEGSFVHQEFHQEEKARRKSGLTKGVQRIPHPSAARRGAETGMPRRPTDAQKAVKSIGGVISWIVFAIIALNILSSLLFGFLGPF